MRTVAPSRISRTRFFATLLALLVLPVAGSAPLAAQEDLTDSARDRDLREFRVKAEKMKTHLLPYMREHGVDLWIILSRENNPDPALELFGGHGIDGWYGARNAYFLEDTGEGLRTTVIGTHLSEHLSLFYDDIRGYGQEGLMPHLREYVHTADPEVIAVNRSPTISMADGLSAELEDYLVEAVGMEYADRIVSSEPLFIDYVSRRTPAELAIQKDAAWKTWWILKRAFSAEVITPGETTLMDVFWWIKDEWMAQDLDFNFPAGLDIQRLMPDGTVARLDAHDDPVIQPGDLLHVDFGVKLSGLVTDQQKMAYVLRDGETDAPEGMRRVFEQSVRTGDIIMEELVPGTEGRVVQERATQRAESEGIAASIYSHVQGNWVHGVGAWAIWDWYERYGEHPRQPVRPTEFWSIEYNVTGPVPEWGGAEVQMSREEDAYITEDGERRWTVGPQMELWLIGQPDVGFGG